MEGTGRSGGGWWRGQELCRRKGLVGPWQGPRVGLSLRLWHLHCRVLSDIPAPRASCQEHSPAPVVTAKMSPDMPVPWGHPCPVENHWGFPGRSWIRKFGACEAMEGLSTSVCPSTHPSFLPFIFLLPLIHLPWHYRDLLHPAPGLGCSARAASEWVAQGQAH